MTLIPVEGHNGLYRDSKTNAIINKNKNEYEAHLRRKKAIEDEKNRISNLENDISSLKNELSEIQILLRRLLEK